MEWRAYVRVIALIKLQQTVTILINSLTTPLNFCFFAKVPHIMCTYHNNLFYVLLALSKGVVPKRNFPIDCYFCDMPFKGNNKKKHQLTNQSKIQYYTN